MTDLTIDALCVRHPNEPSVGACERCGKSFCGECRVEDVAAECVYCSDDCRDRGRAAQPGARTDAELLEGYSRPIRSGARSWARSFRPIATAVGPLAGITTLFTFLYGGLTAEAGGGPDGTLILILIAIGVFGIALVGVVASRAYTRQSGSNAYLYTLRRVVPWIVTWMLMVGVTVLGYLLLIIPGIYFSMRVFWADEFALAHRASPFKALNESWQISRGHFDKTFILELLMGWMLFAMVIAVVLPLVALYNTVEATVPHAFATEAIFAGLGMFAILLAYSLVHSMQISLFYALRARHAALPATEARKPMPRILQWSSVPVAVLVCALLGLGILVETGNVPSDRVLAGTDVPHEQYDALLAEGILGVDETVEYFYAEGLFSVLDGGSVLTNRRVIGYETNESGAIDVYSLPLGEVSSVELVQQGDTLNFSIYKVLSRDAEAWIFLFLPHEYGDDRKFVTALKVRAASVKAGIQ